MAIFIPDILVCPIYGKFLICPFGAVKKRARRRIYCSHICAECAFPGGCLGPYSRTSCRFCKSIFLQLSSKVAEIFKICKFYASSYSRINLLEKSCRFTQSCGKSYKFQIGPATFAELLQVYIRHHNCVKMTLTSHRFFIFMFSNG